MKRTKRTPRKRRKKKRTRTDLSFLSTARQVQESRLRQVPAGVLPLAPAPPDGPDGRAEPEGREAVLRAVRGRVQPEVVAARGHRRRLLRDLIPQHHVPGVPGAGAAQDPRALRRPRLRLQGPRPRRPRPLAERPARRHAAPPAQARGR